MPNQRLGDGKVAALRYLKEAYDNAAEAKRQTREFAPTQHELLIAGASMNDLRWLLAKRLIEQIVAATSAGNAEHPFHQVSGLKLVGNGYFALTYLGNVFVERHVQERSSLPADRRQDGSIPAVPKKGRRLTLHPVRWDSGRHELSVAGKLAKRFIHAAPRQWDTFDRFEADGWRGPVDINPPGAPQRDPSQRLRELVKELNQGLDQSLIRFRKDPGTLRIAFDLP